MRQWHVKAYRDGDDLGQPLGPYNSANEAIHAANTLLADEAADEVHVYHQAYPNDASQSFSSQISDQDVHELAHDLEQKAVNAAPRRKRQGRFTLDSIAESPLARTIRTMQRLQDVADPPAFRKARRMAELISGAGATRAIGTAALATVGTSRFNAIEAAAQYGAMHKTLERMSGLGATLQSLANGIAPGAMDEIQKGLWQSQRISDELQKSALERQKMSHTLTGAARIAESMRWAQAAFETNSLVQRCCDSDQFRVTFELVGRANAAIPRFVERLARDMTGPGLWPNLEAAAAHRQQVLELVELNARCGAPSLLEMPTDLAINLAPEVYRALDLHAVLSGDDDSNDNESREGFAALVRDEIVELLAELNPSLVPVLQGARASLNGSNVEVVRNVCGSLRELFREVLDSLAPDAEIKNWSKDPGHFSNGHATRRARMEFALAGVDGGPLKNLIKADIKRATELVGVLNQGAHQIPPSITREQLQVVSDATEAAILSFLRAARYRNN